MEIYTYRAKYISIVDGDTVDLYIDQGFHTYRKERFRLLGINTPEIHSKIQTERDQALAAKQYLASLLTTATDGSEFPLIIKTQKADSFGRWLADIYVGDTLVNKELLDKGYAVPFKK